MPQGLKGRLVKAPTRLLPYSVLGANRRYLSQGHNDTNEARHFCRAEKRGKTEAEKGGTEMTQNILLVRVFFAFSRHEAGATGILIRLGTRFAQNV